MSKFREAALRLGKSLEDMGWTVFEVSRKCTKCTNITSHHHLFCHQCGAPMREDPEEREYVVRDLEKALKEALDTKV